MRHRGLSVHAFKATGVSLRRDILAMEDSGARRSMIFTDLGIVTINRASVRVPLEGGGVPTLTARRPGCSSPTCR
mgnify:CR=1 FL=1